MKQVNAGTAKAVIAATSSELANLEIALLARETNPKQRVVVRLFDPDFAEAVRAAADVRHALSIPALAAPAFVAALFGDRVQTLITAAGRTLVVIEVVIDPDDAFLNGKSLRALMLDYRLLPVAFAGHDPGDLRGHRLKIGDRVTFVAELPDLERLIRREAAPVTASVVVESVPPPAKDSLATLVQVKRNCSKDQAEALVKGGAFTLAEGLTRGEAQELVEQVTREGVTARIL